MLSRRTAAAFLVCVAAVLATFVVKSPAQVVFADNMAADAPCKPVIKACGCGMKQDPKTKKCVKGSKSDNMHMCDCQDKTSSGKIVKGKCVDVNKCEATTVQDENGQDAAPQTCKETGTCEAGSTNAGAPGAPATEPPSGSIPEEKPKPTSPYEGDPEQTPAPNEPSPNERVEDTFKTLTDPKPDSVFNGDKSTVPAWAQDPFAKPPEPLGGPNTSVGQFFGAQSLTPNESSGAGQLDSGGGSLLEQATNPITSDSSGFNRPTQGAEPGGWFDNAVKGYESFSGALEKGIDAFQANEFWSDVKAGATEMYKDVASAVDKSMDNWFGDGAQEARLSDEVIAGAQRSMGLQPVTEPVDPKYARTGDEVLDTGDGKDVCGAGVCSNKFTPEQLEEMKGKIIEDARVSRYPDREKTAYGGVNDPNAFTAASKEFPNEARILQYNPATGDAAVVKVNDTGPFIVEPDGTSRAFDNTPVASDALGIGKGQGVGNVEAAYMGQSGQTGYLGKFDSADAAIAAYTAQNNIADVTPINSGSPTQSTEFASAQTAPSNVSPFTSDNTPVSPWYAPENLSQLGQPTFSGESYAPASPINGYEGNPWGASNSSVSPELSYTGPNAFDGNGAAFTSPAEWTPVSAQFSGSEFAGASGGDSPVGAVGDSDTALSDYLASQAESNPFKDGTQLTDAQASALYDDFGPIMHPPGNPPGNEMLSGEGGPFSTDGNIPEPVMLSGEGKSFSTDGNIPEQIALSGEGGSHSTDGNIPETTALSGEGAPQQAEQKAQEPATRESGEGEPAPAPRTRSLVQSPAPSANESAAPNASGGNTPERTALSGEGGSHSTDGNIPERTAISGEGGSHSTDGNMPEPIALSGEGGSHSTDGNIPEPIALSGEGGPFSTDGNIPEHLAITGEGWTHSTDGNIPETTALSGEGGPHSVDFALSDAGLKEFVGEQLASLNDRGASPQEIAVSGEGGPFSTDGNIPEKTALSGEGGPQPAEERASASRSLAGEAVIKPASDLDTMQNEIDSLKSELKTYEPGTPAHDRVSTEIALKEAVLDMAAADSLAKSTVPDAQPSSPFKEPTQLTEAQAAEFYDQFGITGHPPGNPPSNEMLSGEGGPFSTDGNIPEKTALSGEGGSHTTDGNIPERIALSGEGGPHTTDVSDSDAQLLEEQKAIEDKKLDALLDEYEKARAEPKSVNEDWKFPEDPNKSAAVADKLMDYLVDARLKEMVAPPGELPSGEQLTADINRSIEKDITDATGGAKEPPSSTQIEKDIRIANAKDGLYTLADPQSVKYFFMADPLTAGLIPDSMKAKINEAVENNADVVTFTKEDLDGIRWDKANSSQAFKMETLLGEKTLGEAGYVRTDGNTNDRQAGPEDMAALRELADERQAAREAAARTEFASAPERANELDTMQNEIDTMKDKLSKMEAYTDESASLEKQIAAKEAALEKAAAELNDPVKTSNTGGIGSDAARAPDKVDAAASMGDRPTPRERPNTLSYDSSSPIGKTGLEGLAKDVIPNYEKLTPVAQAQAVQAMRDALIDNPNVAKELLGTNKNVIKNDDIVFPDKGTLNLSALKNADFQKDFADNVQSDARVLTKELGGTPNIQKFTESVATPASFQKSGVSTTAMPGTVPSSVTTNWPAINAQPGFTGSPATQSGVVSSSANAPISHMNLPQQFAPQMTTQSPNTWVMQSRWTVGSFTPQYSVPVYMPVLTSVSWTVPRKK